MAPNIDADVVMYLMFHDDAFFLEVYDITTTRIVARKDITTEDTLKHLLDHYKDDCNKCIAMVAILHSVIDYSIKTGKLKVEKQIPNKWEVKQ